MKSNNNIFTILFILIAIGLIIGAVYILYYSNGNDPDEEDVIEVKEEKNDIISVVENLKMGISGYDTMNPLITNNKEILNLDKLIFEPLVNITSDYHAENCLAKDISYKSDTEVQVKIDSTIKWQDGSSLISKDIQFTVDRLKELNTVYTSNVRFIASVETPDSETAILKLTEPIPFFEYYLDFPIVSSSYYINEDFRNSNKIPMGTGMYKIASIDDDNIFLIRSDRWRNLKSNMPKTESITIHKSNAIGELFNSFKLGNVDVLNTYMTNYADYVGSMGYNKKEYPGREYTFIGINCEDSILYNKEVRRAINSAISRDIIVSSVLSGTKMPSAGPLDYGSYLNNTDGKIEYNQDEAKRILEADGWTYTSEKWQKNVDGYVRKLTLSMVVNEENQERVSVAESIKSQLEEIGISLNLAKVNGARYRQYLNEKNYQMILTGITNSINPDLAYFYGTNNIANYNNENTISKVNDLGQYREIQKIANEDVPYIGLYRNKGTIILNANVGGNFTPNSYFTYYNFNEWYRQR